MQVEEKKWESVNDTIIVVSHQPTFHLLFPKAACRRYRLPSTQSSPPAWLAFLPQ